MRRLRSLQEAWPRLELLYQQKAHSDGVYPLLTPKQQRFFDQQWIKTSQRADSSSTSDSFRSRQAAVLVVLCSVDGQPSILLTRRSPSLALHASEISFPGGHYDPDKDDGSLQATALREAKEELLPPPGILENDLRVYGQTTPVYSLKGTPVTSFLAVLGQSPTNPLELQAPLSQTFPGDRSEVDLVFHVTLHHLIESETTHQLPENRFGMVHAPLFPTPQGDVWGLTAFILRPLLHQLWMPAFSCGADDPEPSSLQGI